MVEFNTRVTPRDELVRSVGRLLTPLLTARLAPSRNAGCESASVAVRFALQRNVATTLAGIPATNGRSWLEELLVARLSSVEVVTEALFALIGETPTKDEVAGAVSDIGFLTQLRSLLADKTTDDHSHAPGTSEPPACLLNLQNKSDLSSVDHWRLLHTFATTWSDAEARPFLASRLPAYGATWTKMMNIDLSIDRQTDFEALWSRPSLYSQHVDVFEALRCGYLSLHSQYMSLFQPMVGR